MVDIIEDGTGKGFKALVDSENKLNTRAVQESEQSHSVADGNAFNVNTGDIALSTANESAVFYFKNTGDDDIQNQAMIYLLGNSSGTGDTVVKLIANPTSVDFSTNVDINGNLNLGSNTVLQATAYKGAEGKAVTGGTDLIISRFSGVGRKAVAVPLLLKPNNAIAVTVTPPPCNGAMIVQIAMPVYIRED